MEYIPGDKMHFIKQYLRFSIAVTALLGVLSVALFWGVGMHQGANHSCIAAMIQSMDCPNASSAQAAAFHIGTVKFFSFFLTNIVSFAFVLLMLSFLVLRGVVLSLLKHRLLRYWYSSQDMDAPPPGVPRHWLALFEHSPASP